MIIFQFEKASLIHSIDVGNEGSAFVEILVGLSSSDSPDDYQVSSSPTPSFPPPPPPSDVFNKGSAFKEIFVGLSLSDSPDDFQVRASLPCPSP